MSPEVSAGIASVITAALAFTVKLLSDAAKRRDPHSDRPPKPEVKVVYVTEEQLRKLVRFECRKAMRGSYHDDETDT